MSNEKLYNYGYDVQLLYIELFLTDLSTFVICQSIFDHTLFDKKLQPVAKFINDFVNEHRVLPMLDIVNATTKSEFKPLADVPPEAFDWLLKDFESFVRHKGLEKAIIESSELLASGMYGLVEEKIKTAVQKSLNKDLGTNYYYDPRGRLMKIKDNNGQMSTGWPGLDKLLYGGLNRGELSIFCAQSGGGKSLFLANLGLNWSIAGLNVLYITLELAEELVALRLDAMSTGINTKNIFKSIDDVELKVKVLGKKNGSLQIKYMPSGKTCNDIRAYLKEYETKMNIKVDVLLIDYLDLMHPIGKNISAENLFMKDKYVSEELRNLAHEQRCITITAAQLNRSAQDETEFNHAHISGGLSKIQTADNVFAIQTSKPLRERGKYELQLLKTRNSSGVGQKIMLDFNVETLRITGSDEDPDDNSVSMSQLMINSMTRTSVVTPISEENKQDDTHVKKSKVDVNTSSLRNLISQRSAGTDESIDADDYF
jgi:KaiC/GvpD/RAD55 family RecA-like ATPase